MLERICKNAEEFQNAHLEAIAKAATESQKRNSPVRILDLATGPNTFNPLVAKRLGIEGVDYELVLTDISPSNLIRGYANLAKALTEAELKGVSVILTDSNNLRKNHTQIPIYHQDGLRTSMPLGEVLQQPKFYFLVSGYNGTKRKDHFETQSFDLVIGILPYSSMQSYANAIPESVRVLRIGGFHIVQEWQVETINETRERTNAAMRGARIRYVDDIRARLDAKLHLEAMLNFEHPYEADYYNPDECVQRWDMMKDVVMVHRKL